MGSGSGGLGSAAGDRAGAAAGSAAASGKSGAAGSAAPAGNGAPVAGAAGSNPALRKSKGCGKDPVLPDASLQVSGMSASYVLDLPMAYDKTRAYPLVMAFREAGTTADAFRTSLNLVPVTGSDAIVVHPNCMNDAASWDIQRDSLLVDTLLAKLEASYCIDQGRVFALGHGAGAMFTSLLGCVRGDKLRAIAALSGAPPPPGGCVGQVAVWLLQGNMDTSTVGPGLGNRDFWAAADACDVSMALPVAPAPCVEYAGCAAGFPVRYCTYDGGPDLPSFAASAAWSFFKGL
jgi:poly(3-hydroxybutyrate) depolymerase